MNETELMALGGRGWQTRNTGKQSETKPRPVMELEVSPRLGRGLVMATLRSLFL